MAMAKADPEEMGAHARLPGLNIPVLHRGAHGNVPVFYGV